MEDIIRGSGCFSQYLVDPRFGTFLMGLINDKKIRPLAFMSQDIGGSIVKMVSQLGTYIYFMHTAHLSTIYLGSHHRDTKAGEISRYSLFNFRFGWYILEKKPYLYNTNTTLTVNQVFLDCPHRNDNCKSLIDSMVILIASSQSLPSLGLIESANSSAAMIMEVNFLFLESNIMHRMNIINVVSAALDGKSRVFAEGTCIMSWNSQFHLFALPSDHFSLLCGEEGKNCIKMLKKHEPYIG